ncbi:diiron oxygenase [Demequina mangrovi]|uniref:Uncharacterized protein n=1 Tax=Demequina mangrovi TaxID=1043493 RepID=A0A1H6XB98_9MICO|nr:diiron oxygenase [Demequina mangrovi]SEJ21805.1 hypothetical protein SAMN05421637_1194 [Demequina mangrovi]
MGEEADGAKKRSIFDPLPEEQWDEPDDDPGDVIPPVAVDMEILHPVERHSG